MPIYLGSTLVDDLYLGDVVYGSPNVVKVYLGTGQVWPTSNSYAVEFSIGLDNLCTFESSLISVFSGASTQYVLQVLYNSTGPGIITWEGSSDAGSSWQPISSFEGYDSATENYVYMNYPGFGTSYRVRAVVDGVATTSVAAPGNYIDFPPCEP